MIFTLEVVDTKQGWKLLRLEEGEKEPGVVYQSTSRLRCIEEMVFADYQIMIGKVFYRLDGFVSEILSQTLKPYSKSEVRMVLKYKSFKTFESTKFRR